jgi:hypothetical protein
MWMQATALATGQQEDSNLTPGPGTYDPKPIHVAASFEFGSTPRLKKSKPTGEGDTLDLHVNYDFVRPTSRSAIFSEASTVLIDEPQPIDMRDYDVNLSVVSKRARATDFAHAINIRDSVPSTPAYKAALGRYHPKYDLVEAGIPTAPFAKAAKPPLPRKGSLPGDRLVLEPRDALTRPAARGIVELSKQLGRQVDLTAPSHDLVYDVKDDVTRAHVPQVVMVDSAAAERALRRQELQEQLKPGPGAYDVQTGQVDVRAPAFEFAHADRIKPISSKVQEGDVLDLEPNMHAIWPHVPAAVISDRAVPDADEGCMAVDERDYDVSYAQTKKRVDGAVDFGKQVERGGNAEDPGYKASIGRYHPRYDLVEPRPREAELPQAERLPSGPRRKRIPLAFRALASRTLRYLSPICALRPHAALHTRCLAG